MESECETLMTKRREWIMGIAKGIIHIPDAPVAGDYDNEGEE